MKKNLNSTTHETFTTENGNIIRYEDLFEGIRKNVEIYGHRGGNNLSKEDLEDIFQDAALKVIRSKERFDLDKCHGRPQAYGSRVATLQERDAFKKAETHREKFTSFERRNEDDEYYEPQDILGASSEECEADRKLESKEAISYIHRKIAQLNENHRRIIELTADGYKPRQIAEILGCEPKEVSSTLFKARLALRKALGAKFMTDYGHCA